MVATLGPELSFQLMHDQALQHKLEQCHLAIRLDQRLHRFLKIMKLD